MYCLHKASTFGDDQSCSSLAIAPLPTLILKVVSRQSKFFCIREKLNPRSKLNLSITEFWYINSFFIHKIFTHDFVMMEVLIKIMTNADWSIWVHNASKNDYLLLPTYRHVLNFAKHCDYGVIAQIGQFLPLVQGVKFYFLSYRYAFINRLFP